MRHEEIKDKLKEVTENRRNQARQLMFECYQNNGELYVNDIKQVLKEALSKFQYHQKNNSEKKLKYIHINCLRISIETETYEYAVRIMDENGYLDNCIIEEDYVPKYLKGLIDADKEYFTKQIMSKVIRAKKYEVKDFLREYIWDTYIKPIPVEISEVLTVLDELEIYKEIIKADNVIVGYGELLERYDKCWVFTV